MPVLDHEAAFQGLAQGLDRGKRPVRKDVLIDAGFNRKDEFFWEGWFGFYGFFGFIACVVLVLAAKELRRLVMRREDYYDE